ncbi:hypothetical protein SKAU_G00303610 [Synaphobranchus kaupii]|uniref:Uncharacterized protein n=1 Tax=Synaphobranchus kaupii TaxID=118154 RepID=A0A9Q1INI3_SYNKA|nr:hypothetical protein SKAU_G00303610 [Synaphobranchus kaupii]
MAAWAGETELPDARSELNRNGRPPNRLSQSGGGFQGSGSGLVGDKEAGEDLGWGGVRPQGRKEWEGAQRTGKKAHGIDSAVKHAAPLSARSP